MVLQRPLAILFLLSVALAALVAVGRLSHLAELRGHLEGGSGVEASMTFNRGCTRDVYYLLVDGSRGLSANHGSYQACA